MRAPASHALVPSSVAAAPRVRDDVPLGAIDAARLEFQGFGETRPLVAPERTPEDAQKNRRVEFIILSR